MAMPTGASPGQAAFIGSASPTQQQVSWLADHSLAAPSHINAMASAARSPFTVTGSPGISTRFPITPARAGHCGV